MTDLVIKMPRTAGQGWPRRKVETVRLVWLRQERMADTIVEKNHTSGLKILDKNTQSVKFDGTMVVTDNLSEG